MRDFVSSPILVTGASRSGASMVAGILEICGVFLGSTPKPTAQDSRSMFENKEIYEQVMKPYLLEVGMCPAGQYPLVPTSDLPIPVKFKDYVLDALHDDHYQDDRPWAYKSNKLVLTWPLWHFAFPNAKWLIIRRRTGDIINSCLKTSFMRAFKTDKYWKEIGAKNEQEAWLWWVHQYEERLIEMISKGLNCKVIWPERMVRGDYSQMYETIEWLGLKWDSKILSYVDPKFLKVRRLSNGKSNR
jgi:hypothetical protein